MDKRKMANYMGTPRGYLIGTLIYACFAAGFVLMANALDETDRIDFRLILICSQWPTALVLVIYAIQGLRMQGLFSRLEKDGQLEGVLADFQSARCFVNDQIRMGERYIYVRGKKKLLSYDQVCGLRQVIETVMGKGQDRKLVYRTPSGKERRLCKLDMFGKSDGDVLRIRSIVNIKRGDIDWPVS